MKGFSASTCFSPSCTTASTRKHPSQGLLAALIASMSHLVAKLKLSQGGSPRRFVTKARRMVHERNRAAETSQEKEDAVWRRAILMGDKCQPLDFSGVIYYDESGNRVQEPPLRSPKSPLLRSPRPNYFGAI